MPKREAPKVEGDPEVERPEPSSKASAGRDFIAHLVDGHPDCLTEAAQLQAASGRPAADPSRETKEGPAFDTHEGVPDSAPESAPDRAYDNVLQTSIRASLSARRALDQERQQVPQLLEELLRFPRDRRQVVICNSRKFRSLALCERLLKESRSYWFSSANQALEYAELAVAVAETLGDEHHDSGVLSDLRAKAWGYLGNAKKILSDHRAAERCFLNAEDHLAQGTGSPTEEARLQEFRIALLTAQRRFKEAGHLADKVLRIYRQVQDRHLQGQVLIRKGICQGYVEGPLTAIRTLRRGIGLVDPDRDDRLTLIGRQALAVHLVEAGRLEEANEEIAFVKPRLRGEENCLPRLRVRWLEGKIALERDDLEAAETALKEAADRFAAAHIGYDAALICLDLAQVYAEQGRNQELRRLALSMVPIFRSRDLPNEALAALMLFQRSAEQEVVTRALVRRITGFVEQARRNSAQRPPEKTDWLEELGSVLT